MATNTYVFRSFVRLINRQFHKKMTYNSSKFNTGKKLWTVGILSSSLIGGAGLYYLKNGEIKSVFGFLNNVGNKHRPTPLPNNNNTRSAVYEGMCPIVRVQAREGKTGKMDDYPLTAREERFNAFASCHFENQIYMTMQDFLESIVEENPRPRIGRFQLMKPQVDKMLANTPSRRKKTKYLFRDIMDKGILSYTEYLFLLCILTKPKAGYEIAFKMFDRDGNKRIDRREFLLMEEIFRKKSQSRKEAGKDDDDDDSVSLLSKFYNVPVSQLKIQETTLLRYFFGVRGTDTLDYDTFSSFMDDLQTEILELEFQEFSKGMPTISEVEFAKVLLRYTNLDEEERETYIDLVSKRIPEEKGITFEQFKNFFQFVNNLDDFEIVLRMYSFADQPMSEDEFGRAVLVTTGQQLSDHVVHTVFQIFDKDDDGKLMQREFMGVMKNRAHRSFREHSKTPVGWAGFKWCVKHELKQSQ